MDPLADADASAGGEARGGGAAAQLLLHAQQVADELRGQAEQQAAEAAAHAEQLRAEAQRLHDEAAADRDLAGRRLAQADSRLADAADEARQSVADSGEQVRMLLEAAETQRQRILAEGASAAEQDRREAAERLADATIEANGIRTGARMDVDRDMAAAGAWTLRLLSMATVAARHQQLETVRAAEELRLAADEDATAVRSQAAQEVEALRKDADTQAHGILADATDVRARANAEAEETLRTARAEAAAAIAAAEEQTAWTQQTMASLLSAAEQEADRLRAAGRAEGAQHVAGQRRAVQAMVHRLHERLRDDVARAEQQAQELADVASGLLASAETEAARLRTDGEVAARTHLTRAEDEAQLVHERAQRREEEATATTQLLRQQVADEVVRNRQAAQDELRQARQFAAEQITAARAEADEVRAKAHAVLDDARTETALLTKRRDEIAAELEGLSGVIQALAVPAAPESSAQADQFPDSHEADTVQTEQS